MENLKYEYKNYIDKVPEGCLIIADLLRKEDTQLALKNISYFAEGMEWIVSVNKVLNDEKLTEVIDIKSIKGFLEEINESLVKQDYNLTADLFEYEIADYFEKLRVD